MRGLKWWTGLSLLCVCMAWTASFASPSIIECPKDLVCFTTEEWSRIDTMRANLVEEKNLLEARLKRSKGKIATRGISTGVLMVDGELRPFAQYDVTIWKFFAAAGLYDGHAGAMGGVRFVF